MSTQREAMLLLLAIYQGKSMSLMSCPLWGCTLKMIILPTSGALEMNEGSSTIHNVPYADDGVKVSVAKAYNGNAQVPFPTSKV